MPADSRPQGEYGFADGVIISDCNDIPALVSFRTAANVTHAAAKGMQGGVDLDLQCGGQSAYTKLQEAITAGLVVQCLGHHFDIILDRFPRLRQPPVCHAL